MELQFDRCVPGLLTLTLLNFLLQDSQNIDFLGLIQVIRLLIEQIVTEFRVNVFFLFFIVLLISNSIFDFLATIDLFTFLREVS